MVYCTPQDESLQHDILTLIILLYILLHMKLLWSSIFLTLMAKKYRKSVTLCNTGNLTTIIKIQNRTVIPYLIFFQKQVYEIRTLFGDAGFGYAIFNDNAFISIPFLQMEANDLLFKFRGVNL